jgi:3-oxoacyl-(acyl-carrier-protein) synthase
MTPVVITGMGIVSAAGRGTEVTLQALREGRSGLGRLRRFAARRNGHLPVAEARDAAAPDGAPIGGPRTLALATDALRQALQAAQLDPADCRDAGLVLGTCVAGMPETEAALLDEAAGRDLDEAVWGRHECGYVTQQLAERAGCRGPVTTVSTACSSSAVAIATAADLLESGATGLVLAGGADALCRLTLNGFAALLNVSPEGCRPFDVRRDGMSLGEGAAFLVLETLEHAMARGVAALGRLAGHGNSCDAHHPTAPHPDGRGAEAAMRRALAMAGCSAAAVDYINAHGTGTVENDRAEGRAIRRVFGTTPPPCSSTKRVFGHTLGAAGAIEAVVSILALRHGMVPGTPGLDEIDPECEITPLRQTLDRPVGVVLSNSFGFGGNNSSLCFTALESTG